MNELEKIMNDYIECAFDSYIETYINNIKEQKRKCYLDINGKEIINDFKEKDEPKAKMVKITADDFIKAYKRVARPTSYNPLTLTIPPMTYIPTIKRVIINEPAVIILWSDGEKTIAKCEDMDTFDAEKGFAIALAKKFVGNERFRNMLEKYVWEVE